mgnify:CR=1 FL=1
MEGSFCHVELTTPDPSTAKTFFSRFMDWGMDEVDLPGGTYTMVHTGEGPTAGIGKAAHDKVPVAWMPYVEVDNLAATVARAESLGAKVRLSPRLIADGIGSYALIEDPTGAVLGLFQAAT